MVNNPREFFTCLTDRCYANHFKVIVYLHIPNLPFNLVCIMAMYKNLMKIIMQCTTEISNNIQNASQTPTLKL